MGECHIKNRVTISTKLGYGVGNFGYGIIYQLMATYLVFYSTAVLDIPGSFIGIAVSVSIIFDAISDPIMGNISDKTYIPILGRRHLYILVGTVLIALFNYLLWSIDPAMSLRNKFYLIFFIIILIKLSITVFITPYTALGAELSKDYNERTSIQAIKTSFFLIGLFFSSAAGMYLFFSPTPDHPIGQLNPYAYERMGIISSILILIFGLISFLSTLKYKTFPKTKLNYLKNMMKTNLLGDIGEALKNRNYRTVVIGYLLTNLSSALISTIGLHIFTYTFLMKSNMIGIIVGTQLIVSVLSQPIWLYISKKMEKKDAVILGLWICIIGSIYFLICVLIKDIVRINYIYLIPFSVFAGFGTGGLYTLPLSMVADTTDEEEKVTGLRKEGTYFGGLTLGYKMSQSISIFLLGFLLDIIGFDPNLEFQTDFVSIFLGVFLAIGSMVSFFLSIFVYKKYTLSKDELEKIQKDL